MAFLTQLARNINKKESENLFRSAQRFDEMYGKCLKLAKKYKMKVPLSFKYTLRNKFLNPPASAFGRPPIRRTIYIYPHQIERIERLAEKRNLSKRYIILEAFNFYLQEMEKSYGK